MFYKIVYNIDHIINMSHGHIIILLTRHQSLSCATYEINFILFNLIKL